MKNVSKSPTQTTIKLIASPTTSSKFSPSQFISNSPVMKQKKLKEKGGINMLEKYTGTKKNDGIIQLISTNKPETSTTTGPVRKNMAFLKSIDDTIKPKLNKTTNYDENDPQFKLNEAYKYENSGEVNKKIGITTLIDDDDKDEVIQYEGWIYKITETNKLKKLWFKLYDKDLFCKFLNFFIIRL